MSFKVIVFLQYSNNESCNHTLARGKEWWGDPHAGGWSDLAEKKENKKRVLSCEDRAERDFLYSVLSLDSGSKGGGRAVKSCLLLVLRT